MNDHTSNQPGTRAKNIELDQEIDQVTRLLTSLEPHMLSTGLHLVIEGKKIPARAKRGEAQLARLFVASLYQQTYNTAMHVKAYTRAINDLTFQLSVTVDPGESEEDERLSKAAKKNAELTRLLYSYGREEGRILDARTVSSKYILIANPRELRGIWRVTEGNKPPIHLCNAAIEVINVTRPMANVSSRDYTLTLRLTNTRDETREITFTSDDIDHRELAAQCIGFCSMPENRFQKECLLEAIKELVCLPGVSIQERTDSLGWFTLPDDTRVWLLSNGVETVTGFLATEKAPFLSPKILSPGNGYHGCEVPAPNDESMQLLLEDLLPQGKQLLAALLGLAARVMLPIPLDDTPGLVRFCSEIIGPSRHGKSRLLNGMLSLFGSRFEYNQGTLLNYQGGNDTSIGRGGLASFMRYQLFTDFDHKASPDNSQFEKIHKIRADTSNIYADNTGGGTVGRQHGGLRARAKPQGALIRTSNYDHSEYSLRHDEEMIEARVCSFVWPKDPTTDTGYARANDEVSHKLEEVRLGIYSWGVAFRKWIMQYNQDQWASYIEDMYQGARGLVYGDTGEWACDLHRNQTVELVIGLLVWQDFINSCYETSFMNDWISRALDQVILDRQARCNHIHSKAAYHSTSNELKEFVTRAIRHGLHSHQLYITSQQDRALIQADTSYQLDLLGYKRYTTNDPITYEHGDKHIGYLVCRGIAIAFITDLLLDTLTREAERTHFDLPDKNEILALLVEAGVIIPDKAGKSSQLVKINGKPGRYLVMPLSMIYSQDFIDPGEAALLDEDETPGANIVSFNHRDFKPEILQQEIRQDTLAGV